jgi:hypothetical protein
MFLALKLWLPRIHATNESLVTHIAGDNQRTSL